MTIQYFRDANGVVTFADASIDAHGIVGNPVTDIGYQAWLAEGNTPTAPPAPAPITPSSLTLTPRQIRLVLNQANLRPQVDAAVAAADQNTKDMWQFSNIFLRTDPVLNAMAAGLGLSSAQIDALFEQGQSL